MACELILQPQDQVQGASIQAVLHRLGKALSLSAGICSGRWLQNATTALPAAAKAAIHTGYTSLRIGPTCALWLPMIRTPNVKLAALIMALTLGGCDRAAEEKVEAPKNAAEPKPSIVAEAVPASDAMSFDECLKRYETAVAAAHPSNWPALNLYSAGCCASLAGSTDAAFEHLNAAAERGFRAVGHLHRDPDLIGLHDDPRWQMLVALLEEKERAYLNISNKELAIIFEQDQSDRHGAHTDIDWSKVGPRDAQRRVRVTEIMESGAVKTSVDYYHAAMVFQHGSMPEAFLRSHELAVKAVEIDFMNGPAKWLAAASKDRYLMHTNQPQHYGTQYQSNNGKWELYEVNPSTTDEERAIWHVPSIADARKQAEKMTKDNPPPPDPFETLLDLLPF